jgi:hypothetical protein
MIIRMWQIYHPNGLRLALDHCAVREQGSVRLAANGHYLLDVQMAKNSLAK